MGRPEFTVSHLGRGMNPGGVGFGEGIQMKSDVRQLRMKVPSWHGCCQAN